MTDYTAGGGSTIVWMLFWAVLGFFVYDGLNGALAMIVLSFLFGLAALLSIIPVVGVFIQYYVSITYILPFIINLTGITATWLTTTMLVVSIIMGIIITAMTTFVLLKSL